MLVITCAIRAIGISIYLCKKNEKLDYYQNPIILFPDPYGVVVLLASALEVVVAPFVESAEVVIELLAD